jgi:hypothetical protein
MKIRQRRTRKRRRVARSSVVFLLGAASLAWARATPEPLSLTISAPDVEIRESNVALHLTMTNHSMEPITLVKGNPGCDFIAEVKDADGHDVPLTKTGTELSRCNDQLTMGRRIRVTLAPGESTEETYPIDLYYGLVRPGRYTVQLMREAAPATKPLTRSNEVVLNLAG